jgi:formylglycine-generating enzyme required for sulfatase activity
LNQSFKSQTFPFWGEVAEQAARQEKQGNYREALALYQKCAVQHESPALQTKMEFCRHILELEQAQEEMLQKGTVFALNGEWVQAMGCYERICHLYETWPENEKGSPRLVSGMKKAQEMLTSLQSVNAVIQPFVEQGRIAQALQQIVQVSTPLPKQGIQKKIYEILLQEMALIPAGPFVMGSNVDEDEMPQHQVVLPEYFIDRYEVTNRQYKIFVKDTGSSPPASWKDGSIPPDYESHPVGGISWNEADEYARWAGKRLPTEAEWEKAARGSDARIYPWGNIFYADCCNSLEAGFSRSTPVGSFPKGISPYGCWDMMGNVSEWTDDPHTPYPGSQRTFAVQVGNRVARGGDWCYDKNALRCSNRYSMPQSARLANIGFRCALSLEEN